MQETAIQANQTSKDKKMENEPVQEQSISSSVDDNLGDVMIVGGGISGIQASLDLATAGYKVYLIDKNPAIGGHMAQLDKTFPTNDCSM
jgi:heterodisulfide reductase subunit A2